LSERREKARNKLEKEKEPNDIRKKRTEESVLSKRDGKHKRKSVVEKRSEKTES